MNTCDQQCPASNPSIDAKGLGLLLRDFLDNLLDCSLAFGHAYYKLPPNCPRNSKILFGM